MLLEFLTTNSGNDVLALVINIYEGNHITFMIGLSFRVILRDAEEKSDRSIESGYRVCAQ